MAHAPCERLATLPRERGEGRRERHSRSLENHAKAPLTRRVELVIGPAQGRTRWHDDLSPQAGRGYRLFRHRCLDGILDVREGGKFDVIELTVLSLDFP